MRKPSDAQLHVLRRMADGWELARERSGWTRRSWLQKAGPSETIRGCTVSALVARGLIAKAHYDYPIQHFRLTEAGRAAVEDSTNG